ncbi:MAG TPA: 30S ribosomal protein S4 [Dehalococcoidales bacterium]|nr:30S ribosomal protein S4 [Dehalococcoidales bacterium]
MIGPACRLCRRSGDKLMLKGDRCFGAKCGVDRRPKPPGPHQATRRRLSDRGIQLREKQKAKYSYGLFERQFKRFFSLAGKQSGITGDNLKVLLERRLDNVVYRLGFADSRSQARQLVLHGHILVNGKKVNIPSYLVVQGEDIAWREGSKKTEYYKTLVEGIKSKTVPNWLNLDRESVVGKVLALPASDSIESKFETTNIVEWYSR